MMSQPHRWLLTTVHYNAVIINEKHLIFVIGHHICLKFSKHLQDFIYVFIELCD